jgi:hypothetical protein
MKKRIADLDETMQLIRLHPDWPRVQEGSLYVIWGTSAHYLYGIGVKDKGVSPRGFMIQCLGAWDACASLTPRMLKDGTYKLTHWFSDEVDAAEICNFILIPTHYIATAGLKGFMPNVCELHDTHAGAIESMIALHELGENGKRASALRKYDYVDLYYTDAHNDENRDAGNEYAEVTECDCLFPEEHQD